MKNNKLMYLPSIISKVLLNSVEFFENNNHKGLIIGMLILLMSVLMFSYHKLSKWEEKELREG